MQDRTAGQRGCRPEQVVWVSSPPRLCCSEGHGTRGRKDESSLPWTTLRTFVSASSNTGLAGRQPHDPKANSSVAAASPRLRQELLCTRSPHLAQGALWDTFLGSTPGAAGLKGLRGTAWRRCARATGHSLLCCRLRWPVCWAAPGPWHLAGEGTATV